MISLLLVVVGLSLYHQSTTLALVHQPPPVGKTSKPPSSECSPAVGVGASESPQSQAATIIGAGPAGLATALMLARRGMSDIHVYERLSAPAASDDISVWSDTAKFYLIGLGGRGQKALQDLDKTEGESDADDNNNNNNNINHTGDNTLWARVDKCCVTVLGRKDWGPGAGVDEGVERIFGDDRPYKTKVIPRDRLTGVLSEAARDDYADRITLHYDTEMTAVRWEQERTDDGQETVVVTLQKRNGDDRETQNEDTVDIRCQLLVGADGTARTLATAMEQHSPTVRVVRYEDDNRRVYKTVPLTIPVADGEKGGKWRGDVNYSARTKDGRVILDALPANTSGDYCAVLLLKADDAYAQPHSSAVGLRALVDETLPQFSPLVSDDAIANVAKKPPSNIPSFRYVGPELHRGGSAVLLGDAIHTVKPYFGLGVNSALEDVIALREALDRHPTDRAAALQSYSNARAEEARALVRISRGLDRPGFLGFLTFVLPIILDGVFHGVAPEFFERNTIALLQRDGITFAEAGAIKRRDRALQIVVLGVGASAASGLAGALLSFVAGSTTVGTPGETALPAGAGTALGLVGFVALLASRVLRVWEPGMAPADVLAKTLQPVTDVIAAEDRGTVTEDDDDDDHESGGTGSKKAAKRLPLPFIGKGGLPLL